MILFIFFFTIMSNLIETPKFYFNTDCVYEPAEDTFLFLDGLQKDLHLIKQLKPAICLEIGTGSGLIIIALIKSLGSFQSFFIATDININSGRIAMKTAELNNLTNSFQMVFSDLFKPFKLYNQVDLLVFNPPYVPTHDMEAKCDPSSLTRSWAGGKNGRNLIDRFVESSCEIMSETGFIYLLVVKENKPNEIIENMKKRGFKDCQKVIEKKCRNEHLMVLRFCKSSIQLQER